MRMIPKMMVAALPLLAACAGSDESADDRPEVVVTTSVLASVVSEIVGEAANVTVIIPDGADPHDFAPSAKDVERINNAVLVVANGLDLEEGLEDVLENLPAAAVFFAAEHVTTRSLADDDHSHEGEDDHSHESEDDHAHESEDDHAHESEDDHAHDHGGEDPHLWLSPFTVSEFVPALATALSTAVNSDLTAVANALVADLLQLDADLADQVATLESCELITGHDELGYFADRYGCEVIGTVIPSATTTAEASAAQIAELEAIVQEHDARAIFVGVGTPKKVAEQIANDTGVPAVELNTHVMGDVENYDQFMRNLTETIVTALS